MTVKSVAPNSGFHTCAIKTYTQSRFYTVNRSFNRQFSGCDLGSSAAYLKRGQVRLGWTVLANRELPIRLKLEGALIAFLLLFGGFDGFVGDRYDVAQDGVHPGVHIVGAFLGRLLHADNSTEDLAYA
jgi:hypothetical protein